MWHTRYAKTDGTPKVLPEAFVAFINLVSSDEDKFDRLSKMGFERGRASYSIKALTKITEWLNAPWWQGDWDNKKEGAKNIDEDGAARVCYREQFLNKRNLELRTTLAAPPITGNAVVDGSLRQIRYVVNAMINELGTPPEQIVVEMARDMSVGVSMRNERESENNKNRTARKAAEAAIGSVSVTVTPSRVRRYLLWKEQGEGHCPYCTKKINLSDALNGAETEYEHILPKSLTQVGLKRSEIVLAHRSCNQEKGNRTPYQAWANNTDRWQVIEMRAQYFLEKKSFRKAKLLLLQDFEAEVLTDESIDGFADRQFHQTSWIAKEAALWLQSICKAPVSVSRGELTAILRRKWKLETVIPQARMAEGLPILDDEGNVITPEEFERYRNIWEGHRAEDKANHTDRKLDKRIDHRHHLIDAITIGLTSRSLFQQMARQYKLDTEREVRGQRPRLEVAEPPLRNVRELALKVIKECPLLIKPDRRPDARIFQETAYGIAQKKGEDRARLTLRQPLNRLIDSKAGTVDQAREAIGNIVSEIIKEIVSKAFEARVSAGVKAPIALLEPIYQNMYGKQIAIKKVVCYTNKYSDNALLIVHQSADGREHTKRLLHDGYAYLETERTDGRILKQELVTIQQAMKHKNRAAQEGVSRLYKGDVVFDNKDGKKYRIGYFAVIGKVFLVPQTDPRAYDAIKEPESGKKVVSFGQVLRLMLVS